MIHRTLESKLIQGLKSMPVVVILGPRQVGKTTLALEFAKPLLDKPVHYLDLELDSDLAKLDDPESYLRQFENQLLVIDEVQRKPDLFGLSEAWSISESVLVRSLDISSFWVLLPKNCFSSLPKLWPGESDIWN